MTAPAYVRKMLISTPYLSDRAEQITASSSASDSLAVNNLIISPQPSTVWRTLDLDPFVVIKLPEDLAEVACEWNTVQPLYTNSGPDATWKVTAAMTEGGLATPTYDSGWIPARPVTGMDRPGEPEWRHALLWLGDDVVRTEPWVKIFWNDEAPLRPDNVAEDFVQWGRLFVSLGWRPPYHRDRGAELMPADERPRRVMSQGGASRIGRSARPKRYRFTVGHMETEEALTAAYELDRVAGASGDVTVVEDPEATSHLHKRYIYGTLDPGGLRHEDFDTWSRAYNLTEML